MDHQYNQTISENIEDNNEEEYMMQQSVFPKQKNDLMMSLSKEAWEERKMFFLKGTSLHVAIV